jgi:hypothetical protein
MNHAVLSRRRLLRLSAVLAPGSVLAQNDLPAKPLRIVCTSAAGGNSTCSRGSSPTSSRSD